MQFLRKESYSQRNSSFKVHRLGQEELLKELNTICFIPKILAADENIFQTPTENPESKKL